jgi:hypothetical protein
MKVAVAASRYLIAVLSQSSLPDQLQLVCYVLIHSTSLSSPHVGIHDATYPPESCGERIWNAVGTGSGIGAWNSFALRTHHELVHGILSLLHIGFFVGTRSSVEMYQDLLRQSVKTNR